MKILGGTSRASVLTLRKALTDAVSKQSANDAATFASELFTILTVLSSSVGLRRALTDNSRDKSAKADLISNLFGKNIKSEAQALLATASSLRWSSPAESLIQICARHLIPQQILMRVSWHYLMQLLKESMQAQL